MGPAIFDLILYRGDSYGYRFKLWQDAEKTIPFDLAGATVIAEIRNKPGGTMITPLDATIVEPNFVDLKITSEMSKASVPSGLWDLEITFATGEVNTPVKGSVSVTADISGSTPTPTP